MIDNNILWSRAIGMNGKIEKEPTLLGSAIIVIGGAVVVAAVAYAILVLFSAL